jgi:hypothetical protein
MVEEQAKQETRLKQSLACCLLHTGVLQGLFFDVSEEHVAFIFRVEASRALLAICFTLVSCLAYSSTLKQGHLFLRNV